MPSVQLLTMLRRFAPGRLARQRRLCCRTRDSRKNAPQYLPCKWGEKSLCVHQWVVIPGLFLAVLVVVRWLHLHSLLPCHVTQCLMWVRELHPPHR